MSEPARRQLYVAEPSPRFGVPKPAVVDTSVVAALLFAEREQPEAARMLSACRPVAPDLLAHEITNVAVNKLRRGEPLDLMHQRLANFWNLAIELVPPDTALTLALAARFKLTAYDAAYLALAGTLQCPLCTFDQRLADAAARYLGGDAEP